MAVKILLADKSITIQKVVEMLFSGRDYEVTCVSDGETALGEAARVVPDVMLADVDLPRVDGYTFAAQVKKNPKLAQTPVILMLSRDDSLDGAKAQQAGIVDQIAKPFESQELIGKVKNALGAAPLGLAEPAPVTAQPAAPAAPAGAQAARPKQAVPSNIFDIISEAPAPGDRTQAADDSVYEVEPVVEVETSVTTEEERMLPTGQKAVEEIRAGLGLGEQAPPGFTNFESLDMATSTAQEYVPSPQPQFTPPAPEPGPMFSSPDEDNGFAPQPGAEPGFTTAPAGGEEALQGVAEQTIARIAKEVLEKVAWEVIPDLAERLIREEIDRLKQG